MGTRLQKTTVAQKAIDAFVGSGGEACEVDWKQIDPDFDVSKHAINARLMYAHREVDGPAVNVYMRSNRDERRIFLIEGQN